MPEINHLIPKDKDDILSLLEQLLQKLSQQQFTKQVLNVLILSLGDDLKFKTVIPIYKKFFQILLILVPGLRFKVGLLNSEKIQMITSFINSVTIQQLKQFQQLNDGNIQLLETLQHLTSIMQNVQIDQQNISSQAFYIYYNNIIQPVIDTMQTIGQQNILTKEQKQQFKLQDFENRGIIDILSGVVQSVKDDTLIIPGMDIPEDDQIDDDIFSDEDRTIRFYIDMNTHLLFSGPGYPPPPQDTEEDFPLPLPPTPPPWVFFKSSFQRISQNVKVVRFVRNSFSDQILQRLVFPAREIGLNNGIIYKNFISPYFYYPIKLRLFTGRTWFLISSMPQQFELWEFTFKRFRVIKRNSSNGQVISDYYVSGVGEIQGLYAQPFVRLEVIMQYTTNIRIGSIEELVQGEQIQQVFDLQEEM